MGERLDSRALDQITQKVIGAAIEVHREMGPGLLESIYELCLCHELKLRELNVQQQFKVPVDYKGMQLDAGMRIDILVDDSVVLEIKSVERVLPVHEAQVLTYLKLTGHSVGLLINFNVPLLRDGLKRIVHNFPEN